MPRSVALLTGVFGIGQSVADFYAEVTINGTKLDNFDQRCDNPPAPPPANVVFDVPLPFFRENDPFVDPSCPNVPDAWTFTVDVPLSSLVGLSKTVPVVIRIKDSDSGPFNDDDTPETIHLKVPFGNRWTGDVNWPNNCNREAVEGSGARICWRIEVGQDSDGDGYTSLVEITNTILFANTPTFPGLSPANAASAVNIPQSEIVLRRDIGASDRVNYTIVGDTVNVSQRLQELGKLVAADAECAIVISGETAARLNGSTALAACGKHRLRGRGEPIDVFLVEEQVTSEATIGEPAQEKVAQGG